MNEGLARLRDGKALGGDLAQLASRHQQDIRFVDQRVGNAIIAAEEPSAQRIGAGDRTLAGHGVGNRDRLRASELAQLLGRLASASSRAARATSSAAGRQRIEGAASQRASTANSSSLNGIVP